MAPPPALFSGSYLSFNRLPSRLFLPGEAMSKRRFEMYHYRQALVRMRQGDSDRDLARARLKGRKKAAQLRELAMKQG